MFLCPSISLPLLLSVFSLVSSSSVCPCMDFFRLMGFLGGGIAKSGATVQWRIQDFPEVVANFWVWGKNSIFGKIFAKNCMEMKEIGPRGGMSLAPSPWIRQCCPLQGEMLDSPLYTVVTDISWSNRELRLHEGIWLKLDHRRFQKASSYWGIYGPSQRWIQDFSDGGYLPQKGERQPNIWPNFAENCMKMEKNWTGDTHAKFYYVDPLLLLLVDAPQKPGSFTAKLYSKKKICTFQKFVGNCYWKSKLDFTLFHCLRSIMCRNTKHLHVSVRLCLTFDCCHQGTTAQKYDAQCGARTHDPGIKSHMLYRLS